MKNYTYLFWDLDHTLWDFEANAFLAIEKIFNIHQLEERLGLTSTSFYPFFSETNKNLWKLLDGGQINHETLRKERFKNAIASACALDISLEDSLAYNQHFLEFLPEGDKLIDQAHEVLSKVHGKLGMSLITNGYQTVQERKVANSGLEAFFELIVCNDTADALKPDPRIFEYALETLNLGKHEVLMIGDNHQTDVMGALNAGIDVVYYNPHKMPIDGHKPTYEIENLVEILEII